MPSILQIIIAFGIVLTFGMVLLLIIVINTVVHEAGHALAMHRLVKGPITVFLGSYGNQAESWLVRVGRFEIWFRKNPFRRRGGLCALSEQTVPVRSQVIYLLAGPLASLLLCVISGAAFYMINAEGVLAALLVLACTYCLVSFLSNIIPRDRTIAVRDGQIAYNDGKHLQLLLMKQRLPPAYAEAIGHYQAGNFGQAADILEGLIVDGLKKKEIYRLAVDASIRSKKYARADALQKEQISKFGSLTSQDKMQLALLKIYLGNYKEAIGYLKHLLELDGQNKFNLNNLGYALTIIGGYEEAIVYLTKAIAVDDQFSYAYANRGYALLQSGQLQAGKADIDRGWEPGAETAHGYRNRGVYHFHTQNYPAALEAFEQARSMDEDVPGLDALLRETRSRMSRETASAGMIA